MSLKFAHTCILNKTKKPLYAMSDKLGKGILFLHSWNSELVKVKFWNSA